MGAGGRGAKPASRRQCASLMLASRARMGEAPQDAESERDVIPGVDIVAPALASSTSVPVPSNGAWKPGRRHRCCCSAPGGGPITPDQIKAIHTLLSRVGNITDEAYRAGRGLPPGRRDAVR